MKKETIIQLKRAGFPRMNDHIACHRCEIWGDENICIPNLSELIEACGIPIYVGCNTKGYWYAKQGFHSQSLGAEGSTPEEAVALLYLALKKKE